MTPPPTAAGCVLLLEGDPYLRSMFAGGLEARGCRVIAASSLDEAVRRLDEVEERPAAILLSHERGGPDWESVLPILDLHCHGVPRLHLREAEMPSLRRTVPGADDPVLTKPIRIDRIVDSISGLIQAA
jgi:DNA-binding response OmpR family regulator